MPYAVAVCTPSEKTEPAGAPETRIAVICSEPSRSVVAAAMCSGMTPSSVPKESARSTSGASATPATLTVKVPGESDQTSPSETLNSNDAEPDQSASGWKVSLPWETSCAEISSPAETGTPLSSSEP